MTRQEIMKRSENSTAISQPRSYYERRIIPPADIIEGSEEYTVRVDMPGVAKESIELKVDGNKLRVKGNTRKYHNDNPRMVLQEITPTLYQREFQLGNEIDRSKINAEYDNGVLNISLHKNEQSKPREIKIK